MSKLYLELKTIPRQSRKLQKNLSENSQYDFAKHIVDHTHTFDSDNDVHFFHACTKTKKLTLLENFEMH